MPLYFTKSWWDPEARTPRSRKWAVPEASVRTIRRSTSSMMKWRPASARRTPPIARMASTSISCPAFTTDGACKVIPSGSGV